MQIGSFIKLCNIHANLMAEEFPNIGARLELKIKLNNQLLYVKMTN